jgi:hypothetical protein
LWHHRRDFFIELTPNLRNYATFLTEEELWTCYDLGVKYKAIHERRTDLQATYEKMRDIDPTFVDRFFEDHVLAVPDGTAELSVEAVGEALAWLEMRYPKLTTEVKQMSIAPEERKQVKRAGGVSASRFSRETPGFGEFVEVRVDLDRSDRVATKLKPLSRLLLQRFGLSPSEVAAHLVTGVRHPRSTDYPIAPLDEADKLVDPDQFLLDNASVLNGEPAEGQSHT